MKNFVNKINGRYIFVLNFKPMYKTEHLIKVSDFSLAEKFFASKALLLIKINGFDKKKAENLGKPAAVLVPCT